MRRSLSPLSAIGVSVGLLLLQTAALAGQTPEEIEVLAAHHQWNGLLHFDRGGLLTARRSAVISPDFFFSPQGRFDPLAELKATLEALNQGAKSSLDVPHAQCRFPARAFWLEHQGFYRWQSDVPCEAWAEWSALHKDRQVGLLFPTGYLGNPASFFGHLLIHLTDDEMREGSASELLQTSYNFGADVPNGEGMVPYVLKGLFGGYEAQFSTALFFENAWVYSEMQMRDLWHYRLDLPEFERKLIVAHLFELERYRYDYLFLTENCASRIGRVLEIVVDQALVPSWSPWVSPEAVVQAVAEAEVAGRPLVSTIEYRPSRRRQTEALYRDLPGEGQRAVAELWPTLSQLELDSPTFESLSMQVRAAVLETLLSHLQALRTTSDEGDLDGIERALLRERIRLLAGGSRPPAPTAVPIHEARRGSRVLLGAVRSSVFGSGIRLSARAMQYDLLDGDGSRQPDAALELFKVHVVQFNSGWELDRFDLFDIVSLHAQVVPLPLTPSLAWRASAGMRRSDSRCRACRDWHVTGLAGRSMRVGSLMPHALVGASLRTSRYQRGFLAARVEVGFVGDFGDRNRSLLALHHEDAFQGGDGRTSSLTLEHRIELRLTNDLRLELRRDLESRVWEVSAGSSWYF